jgi:hypothetical protein
MLTELQSGTRYQWRGRGGAPRACVVIRPHGAGHVVVRLDGDDKDVVVGTDELGPVGGLLATYLAGIP